MTDTTQTTCSCLACDPASGEIGGEHTSEKYVEHQPGSPNFEDLSALVDFVKEWRDARQAWFDIGVSSTQEKRNSVLERLANAEQQLMRVSKHF